MHESHVCASSHAFCFTQCPPPLCGRSGVLGVAPCSVSLARCLFSRAAPPPEASSHPQALPSTRTLTARACKSSSQGGDTCAPYHCRVAGGNMEAGTSMPPVCGSHLTSSEPQKCLHLTAIHRTAPSVAPVSLPDVQEGALSPSYQDPDFSLETQPWDVSFPSPTELQA